MEINDEFRRGVAAELRMLDVSDIGDDDNIVDSPEESGILFSRILEIANDYRPGLHYAMSHFVARDAVDLFADLIDRPTCQMVECTIDHGSRSWGMRCTACGEEFEHMKPSYGWRYCPNCGAEVEQ